MLILTVLFQWCFTFLLRLTVITAVWKRKEKFKWRKANKKRAMVFYSYREKSDIEMHNTLWPICFYEANCNINISNFFQSNEYSTQQGAPKTHLKKTNQKFSVCTILLGEIIAWAVSIISVKNITDMQCKYLQNKQQNCIINCYRGS